jgi:hypothetical protein
MGEIFPWVCTFEVTICASAFVVVDKILARPWQACTNRAIGNIATSLFPVVNFLLEATVAVA